MTKEELRDSLIKSINNTVDKNQFLGAEEIADGLIEDIKGLGKLLSLPILKELNDVLSGCNKAISEVPIGSRSRARYLGQQEGVKACINKINEYFS